MDVLFPAPGRTSTFEIPYLDEYQYKYDPSHQDLEDLDGLSHHHGCSHGITAAEIIESGSSRAAASFLQAQLYFKLLSVFLERAITPSAIPCVSRGSGQDQIVTISRPLIDEAIVALRKRLDQSEPLKFIEHRQRVRTLLLSGFKQLEEFDNKSSFISQEDDVAKDVLSQVILSIKALLCILRDISLDVFSHRKSMRHHALATTTLGDEFQQTVYPASHGRQPLRSLAALKSLFSKNGWCPVRVSEICFMTDFSYAFYLGGTLLYGSRPVEHKNCDNKSRCVAYNIESQHYTPRHVHGCVISSCQGLELDVEKLSKFIMNGKIPIITCDPKALDLSLDVCIYEGDRPYVAISHVWSDGLGNAERNLLQACQLRRIAGFVSALHEMHVKKATWKIERIRRAPLRVLRRLDTLCIPRGSTDPKHIITKARNQAIRHITPIFSRASEVLVLDSEIERMTNKNLTHEEFAAHILGGKWILRAWTLEEGLLARKCIFKLDGDEFRTPPPFTEAAQKQHSKRTSDNYLNHSLQLLDEFLDGHRKSQMKPDMGRKQHRQLEKGRPAQFVRTWNALLTRSATHADDVFKIFGNILDFNAQAITRLDYNMRLPAIITSCQELPLSLLFNAQPEMIPIFHPRSSWIPCRISGDRLVLGARLRVLRNSAGPGPKVVIEKQTGNHSSLRVLVSSKLISANASAFMIHNAKANEHFVVHERLHKPIAKDDGVFQIHKARVYDTYLKFFGRSGNISEPNDEDLTGYRAELGAAYAGLFHQYLEPDHEVFSEHLNLLYKAHINACARRTIVGRDHEVFRQYQIRVYACYVAAFESWQSCNRDAYIEGSSTCFIIDQATETRHADGCISKGAQLAVLGTPEHQTILLRYFRPVSIWTSNRWESQAPEATLSEETWEVSQLSEPTTMVLDIDAELWSESLKRRPILSPLHLYPYKRFSYVLVFGGISMIAIFYVTISHLKSDTVGGIIAKLILFWASTVPGYVAVKVYMYREKYRFRRWLRHFGED